MPEHARPDRVAGLAGVRLPAGIDRGEALAPGDLEGLALLARRRAVGVDEDELAGLSGERRGVERGAGEPVGRGVAVVGAAGRLQGDARVVGLAAVGVEQGGEVLREGVVLVRGRGAGGVGVFLEEARELADLDQGVVPVAGEE